MVGKSVTSQMVQCLPGGGGGGEGGGGGGGRSRKQNSICWDLSLILLRSFPGKDSQDYN